MFRKCIFIGVLLLTTACSQTPAPQQVDVQATVQAAVQATIVSQPTDSPTLSITDTPTLEPTRTSKTTLEPSNTATETAVSVPTIISTATPEPIPTLAPLPTATSTPEATEDGRRILYSSDDYSEHFEKLLDRMKPWREGRISALYHTNEMIIIPPETFLAAVGDFDGELNFWLSVATVPPFTEHFNATTKMLEAYSELAMVRAIEVGALPKSEDLPDVEMAIENAHKAQFAYNLQGYVLVGIQRDDLILIAVDSKLTSEVLDEIKRILNEDPLTTADKTSYVGYESLARSPMSYYANGVRVFGRVVETQRAANGNVTFLRLDIDEDRSGDSDIAVSYFGPTVLEGDYVGLIGVGNGLFTYTTAIGNQRSIPHVVTVFVVAHSEREIVREYIRQLN